MTEVIHAFWKSRGSSTFRPFTSLELWRTHKSFSSCGWTLFRRPRAPSSTLQILDPEWWRGSSFFLVLGTSSPELSIDELRCRFFGVADADDDGVVATGDVGTGGDEAAIGSLVEKV